MSAAPWLWCRACGGRGILPNGELCPAEALAAPCMSDAVFDAWMDREPEDDTLPAEVA